MTCPPLRREDEYRAAFQELIDALDRLPAEHRVVLQLVYGAGLSQQEVAQMIVLPPTTVRLMLAQALHDLGTALGG